MSLNINLPKDIREDILTYENFESIFLLLGSLGESGDNTSKNHIKNIQEYTRLMIYNIKESYPEYNLKDSDCRMISFASMLHDLGKIRIPGSILNKPGKLTAEEFILIKQHPIYGTELLEDFMIKDSIMYKYIYDICLYHHERYDGKGYPNKIKGDKIPIWAQVVSVADVYDALVNAHIYRGPFDKNEAKEMIINGNCGIFNPKVLKAFKESID